MRLGTLLAWSVALGGTSAWPAQALPLPSSPVLGSARLLPTSLDAQAPPQLLQSGELLKLLGSRLITASAYDLFLRSVSHASSSPLMTGLFAGVCVLAIGGTVVGVVLYMKQGKQNAAGAKDTDHLLAPSAPIPRRYKQADTGGPPTMSEVSIDSRVPTSQSLPGQAPLGGQTPPSYGTADAQAMPSSYRADAMGPPSDRQLLTRCELILSQLEQGSFGSPAGTSDDASSVAASKGVMWTTNTNDLLDAIEQEQTAGLPGYTTALAPPTQPLSYANVSRLDAFLQRIEERQLQGRTGASNTSLSSK